jgi:glycerol uptake facilitator-like aquaporin
MVSSEFDIPEDIVAQQFQKKPSRVSPLVKESGRISISNKVRGSINSSMSSIVKAVAPKYQSIQELYMQPREDPKSEIRKDIIAAVMEIFASAIYAFMSVSVAEATTDWVARESIPLTTYAVINGATAAITIAFLILLFFNLSGGHMNCVVTLALASSGNMPIRRAFFYLIGQCIGSVLGVYIGHFIKGGTLLIYSSLNTSNGVILTLLYDALFTMSGILVMFLVFIDFKVKPIIGASLVGLAAGCTIFGAILVGTSLNPVRSLGLAVISNYWDYHYIWWFGSLFLIQTITWSSDGIIFTFSNFETLRICTETEQS